MTFGALLGRCPPAAAPAAVTRRGRSLAPITPVVECFLHAREDEIVHIVEVRQALTHRAGLVAGRSLHFSDEAVKRRPSTQAEMDDAREEIFGQNVVIAAIAGFSDALGDATLEETPCLGADTRFADAELLRKGVEGKRFAFEEEGAKETTGDTGEAVAFGSESHTFDESVAFVQQVDRWGEGRRQSRSFRINLTTGIASALRGNRVHFSRGTGDDAQR